MPTKTPAQKEIIVQQEYSGPLPTPLDFAKYNEVVPNAGDRIISMAENNAEHLRDLQNKAEDSHFKEVRRGQIMAFVLGVLGLFLATYLGAIGHGLSAIGLALIGISSMMSQLIWKRKK